MTILIEAKNVTKIYGEIIFTNDINGKADKVSMRVKNATIAIKNINLSICEGDFLCVMGPSGSGKSTLLQNLTTIDKPTKGSVLILGKDVKNYTEKELGKFRFQNLGFVFQESNLLDSLTIYENIAMAVSLHQKDSNKLQEQVKQISEMLRISTILDKFPPQCSGGQCQRAAIARAIIMKPKLIVADEPTGNLDFNNSLEILKVFKDLNESENRTILMVTHDPFIASFSKKIIFLADGEIEYELVRGQLSQKAFYKEILEQFQGRELFL